MKMETSAKLYSLNYSNVKTYLFALLFVAGNIALPQLCHLVPYGGPTLLPIYFFTLIAFKRTFGSCLIQAGCFQNKADLIQRSIQSKIINFT